jgi:hypothetical protein
MEMTMNNNYIDSKESEYKEKTVKNWSNNDLDRDTLMKNIWLDPETWNTLLYENVKTFIFKVRKVLES